MRPVNPCHVRHADPTWFFDTPSDWKILSASTFDDHPGADDVAALTHRVPGFHTGPQVHVIPAGGVILPILRG